MERHCDLVKRLKESKEKKSFDYDNTKTLKSKKCENNNIGGLYDVLILIQQKTNGFIL
jgi:hypothetical protein